MSTTDATLPEVIEQALFAATRAPSVHNTQPWRFVVASPLIEVQLDRERTLPVVDPTAREARMSCGAALFNLRLALQAAGRAVVTDLLPDPARPDLISVLRMSSARPATPEHRTLASAVSRRVTNRRPFTERAVPPPHRHELVRAAETEKARLVLLDTPKSLDILATLLRRADNLQEEDVAFQGELYAWTAGGTDRDDGVARVRAVPEPHRCLNYSVATCPHGSAGGWLCSRYRPCCSPTRSTNDCERGVSGCRGDAEHEVAVRDPLELTT